MIENLNNAPQKRFLAFCVNFPQDLPAHVKTMFNTLLNNNNTTLPRVQKESNIKEFPLMCDYLNFMFKDDANHLDIFYSLRSVMDQCQRGKNPSIAFGTPHHGFDLVFIELLFNEGAFFITDSYLIQNAFITQLEHYPEENSVRAAFSGFYAENQAVADLAKTLIEQNIKPKQTPEDALVPTSPAELTA